ncbi:YdaU family protein [Limnoglobus roseus]|uniref:YdaU family protein n=1 Tax=Limnoglobus roseus TaxID=2598579 RepID=UPI0011EB578D|nr:YdaU family protein [Limnoglobus roseus]
MAENNQWYPFYTGDYARKTAHLSLLEHGAYRLLLDHYYATGIPLPNDHAKLFRICRARTPSERQSVLSAASEFFIEDGTLLRSKRCDREIAKRLRFKDSQTAKANIRHSRGTPAAHAEVRAETMPTTTTTTDNKGKKPLLYSGEFEIFWSAYPDRAGSKKEAFKSYTDSLKIEGVTNETIIRSVERYSRYLAATGYTAAHATTWLNQHRWEGDYSIPNQPFRLYGSGNGIPVDRRDAATRARDEGVALIEKRNRLAMQADQSDAPGAERTHNHALPNLR